MRANSAPQEVRDADQAVEGGFVTVTEAAAYLSLCRAKIYQIMDAGELRYAKFGKSRRIPRQALQEYARRCLVG
jgi:excisionase family DNA binding protein